MKKKIKDREKYCEDKVKDGIRDGWKEKIVIYDSQGRRKGVRYSKEVTGQMQFATPVVFTVKSTSTLGLLQMLEELNDIRSEIPYSELHFEIDIR